MPFDPSPPDDAFGYLIANVSELLALTEQQRTDACASLVAVYSGTPVDAALTTSFKLWYNGTVFRICAADGEPVCGDVADPWKILTEYGWPT